jgi:hypothetical protein
MGLDAVIFGRDERELASKRVGNVAHVGFLRDATTAVLGSQSVVVTKILYSATHSGDSLAKSELEPLARELQILQSSSEADVRSFACAMLDLVQLALKHETTICFV